MREREEEDRGRGPVPEQVRRRHGLRAPSGRGLVPHEQAESRAPEHQRYEDPPRRPGVPRAAVRECDQDGRHGHEQQPVPDVINAPEPRRDRGLAVIVAQRRAGTRRAARARRPRWAGSFM